MEEPPLPDAPEVLSNRKSDLSFAKNRLLLSTRVYVFGLKLRLSMASFDQIDFQYRP